MMDAGAIVLTVLGIILGILGSVVVSRHYHRRALTKRLTPYTHFGSALLRGIDPAVRKDLRISFKGQEIGDLFQYQFLIANTGEVPISHVIENLTAVFPDGIRLLDASIVDVEPQGLKITPQIVRGEASPDKLILDFPLLNSGDCFVVKVLSKGAFTPADVRFGVVAEGIPPTLTPDPLPLDRTLGSENEWKDSVLLGGGALGLLLALAYLGWLLYQSRPQLFPFPWESFRFDWAADAALFAVGLMIIGLATVVGAACWSLREEFPRRKLPFALPRKMRTPHRVLVSTESGLVRVQVDDSATKEVKTKKT